jgi:sporulation protein YlmC with PRC-barrel domain
MLEVATMAGAAPGTGVAATGTPAAAGTPAATKAATAAATTSANATTTANAERTMVRASELIDSKVVDMKGTLVGTVLEVLADKAGTLQYVIVDATSFLGAGTSTGGTGAAATGTPAAAGTTSATAAATKAATSAATSAATTAATKAATAVATTSSAVGTQTGQIGLATKDTVLVYTGTQSELKTSGLPVDRKVLDAEGFVVDTTAAKAQMDAKLNGMIRLGKFGEFKVNDAKNDKLGDVKDLILDAQQGKLQYGVIDFGGFLGIGEQTVAVPWQRFTLNAPAGATASANLTLDVTEQTLRNAPKFDISKWPAWPQPLPTGWENETRTFWQTAS